MRNGCARSASWSGRSSPVGGSPHAPRPGADVPGRANLNRNRQNGRLWWNDPDCILLPGDLPDDEYRFHASVVFATGGMLLSGDDVTKILPQRLAMLRKLLPPTGVAAAFEDETPRVGHVPLRGRSVTCLLNWEEQPQTLSFRLREPCRVADYWIGEDLGRREGSVDVKDVPGHAGRLLVCEPLAP